MDVKYDFNEHRHRFAVWTAARAVARNFTGTKNIEQAINAADLRKFVEGADRVTQTSFDNWHQLACKKIQKSLREYECSYGQGAKIIAIYLKTAVVLPSKGKKRKSKFIHPPIDAILLKNLAQTLPGLRSIRWTAMDKTQYWKIVKTVRSASMLFNWNLEKLWYS